MNLWHTVEGYVGMPGTYHWAVLGFVLVATLIAAAFPEGRGRSKVTLILFALSLAGLLTAAQIQTYYAEDVQPTAARWIRWWSIFIQFVAVTNLIASLIFDVLLRLVGLRPPGLLRDLILA